MNANLEASPRPPLSGLSKVRIAQFVAGGIAGGLLGVFVGRAVRHGAIDAASFTWSDHTALVLGAVMLAVGVGIGLMSLSGAPMDRTVDPSGRRRASPAQRGYYRMQAVVLALAGVMMIIPPLATGLAAPLPADLGLSLMTAIAVLFAIQTAFNVLVWRRSDELVRQMVAESGAIAFWSLQGALFLWAAGEKLGIAPAATAWELMTVMMGAYLAISTLTGLRRGFS